MGLLSVLLGLALCLHGKARGEENFKGPEEAEDFEENDLEEPNDEEQNALSEDENGLDVRADPFAPRIRGNNYQRRRRFVKINPFGFAPGIRGNNYQRRRRFVKINPFAPGIRGNNYQRRRRFGRFSI